MQAWIVTIAFLLPGADASLGTRGRAREPIVISFPRLEKGKIHPFILVYSLDGDPGRCTPLLISGGDPRTVRDNCRRLLVRRGWDVLSDGESKLVVVSNPEGKLVTTVSIEGIPASVTPAFRK